MTLAKTPSNIKPLRGIRILSLALNLPGPAALMRLRAMGATCTKLEPPSGDPMYQYNRLVYDTLHQGVKRLSADLRTTAGRNVLQTQLIRTDVLLTSFRPSALVKLGLTGRASSGPGGRQRMWGPSRCWSGWFIVPWRGESTAAPVVKSAPTP